MNISLNWFKSKAKIQLENLQVEKQKLENEILRNVLPDKSSGKPYKSAKLVNNVLTIVLNNGDLISKSDITTEQFTDIRNSVDEDDLLNKINTNKIIETSLDSFQFDESNESIRVSQNFNVLSDSGEFEIEGDSVYMKGIKRSVPTLLAAKFVDVIEEVSEEGVKLIDSDKYQSLKKFWMKCCLNPNAQSAEDLYTFLSYHQFKIDKHGNFYAYRRVVSLPSEGSKELVEFVSNAYNKVKAVWKKSPSDYIIEKTSAGYNLWKSIKDETGLSGKLVGNLKELYDKLPEMLENRYTDSHTRTEDYRVGRSVSMPRNEGSDDNTVSCYKGSE